MTLQEILKAKGLADDIIGAVLADMKQNKIFTASEENLDIRYKKLKDDHDLLTTQHGEATQLIEQLKANAQNDGVLQNKITSYETTIADLTKQLEDQKVESAMDRTLTAAGAKPEDLDYLKFQWRKKGDIALDDNGEIKGGEDAIAGLKTQHPVQFVSASNQRELEPHKLPDGNNNDGGSITKEQFNKMGYNSRVKLRETDPELYNQLMKG